MKIKFCDFHPPPPHFSWGGIKCIHLAITHLGLYVEGPISYSFRYGRIERLAIAPLPQRLAPPKKCLKWAYEMILFPCLKKSSL